MSGAEVLAQYKPRDKQKHRVWLNYYRSSPDNLERGMCLNVNKSTVPQTIPLAVYHDHEASVAFVCICEHLNFMKMKFMKMKNPTTLYVSAEFESPLPNVGIRDYVFGGTFFQ